MMVSTNKNPHWFFYLGWVVLNVIAVVMAWYVAFALISLIKNIVGGTIQVGGQSHITEDFLFSYVLFPIIGLSIGLFQYTLLRQYLPRMAGWIAATLLGWLIPFVAGYFMIALFPQKNDTFVIMLGMFVIGTAMVVPQWWMLRQRVRYASWWILAHGFGWSMIGLLNLVTSEPFPVLLAIALMPPIATGVACWLLLDWLPKHELNSSAPSYFGGTRS